MTRVMLAVLLLVLSACGDDPHFYTQPSIVVTGDKECVYVGAELQECYSRTTGKRI